MKRDTIMLPSDIINPHGHGRGMKQDYKITVCQYLKESTEAKIAISALMPNTIHSIIDLRTLEEYISIMEKAERELGIRKQYLFFGITDRNLRTCETALQHERVIGLKDYPLGIDGKSVTTGTIGVIYRETREEGVRLTRNKGKVYARHCDNPEIIAKEGYTINAETTDVNDMIEIAGLYPGAKVIICHVSCEESAKLILGAQDKGLLIAIEIAPQYLWFDSDRTNWNPTLPPVFYHFYNNLRSRENRLYLQDLIKKDNPFVFIVSDSACHLEEEKIGNDKLGGIPTHQEMVPVIITLAKELGISDLQVGNLLSFNAGRFLKIPFDEKLIRYDIKKRVNNLQYNNGKVLNPWNGSEMWFENGEMKVKNFTAAKIVDCHETSSNSGIYHLKFDWKDTDISPGQFITIKPLDGNKESVSPRPFSVAHIHQNSISVLIKIVGDNTKAFSKLKRGDLIKVSGPHGEPIQIDSETKNYILVGGGIGIVPLLPLAKKLAEQGKFVTVFLGGKTQNQIIESDKFKEYGCKVETIAETRGQRTGYVTELLEKELSSDDGVSTIIACGPKLMLKAVADIAEISKNKCLVILEELMACGIGSCKGCAVFGTDKSVKHVCTDGPAFDAAWLDWEKLIPSTLNIISAQPEIVDYSMKTVLSGKNEERTLILEYPFMNASGCLGIEAIENGFVDIEYAGALVSKGVTLVPRLGNAMPRICEIPSGLINSIGLENPGIDKFITDELQRWLNTGKPIIVNISGFSVEEYAEVASRLSDTPISAIEINPSCPNIKQGGTIFGLHPEMVHRIVRGVRNAAPEKVLITKLSPMAVDSVEIAKASIEGGTDIISGINTLLGMAIDIESGNPKIAMKAGGMSGSVIHPLAIRIIWQLAAAELGVPLIGMGGIACANDAIEFFRAGAIAIAVGTNLFPNPNSLTEIHNETKEWMISHNISRTSEFIRKVQK